MEDKGYISYKSFVTAMVGVVSVVFSATFAYVELKVGTSSAVQARQDERLNRIEEDILRLEQYILNTLNNDAEQTAKLDAITIQLEQIQERITRQETRLNNR